MKTPANENTGRRAKAVAGPTTPGTVIMRPNKPSASPRLAGGENRDAGGTDDAPDADTDTAHEVQAESDGDAIGHGLQEGSDPEKQQR